jgi:hypothetical protein
MVTINACGHPSGSDGSDLAGAEVPSQTSLYSGRLLFETSQSAAELSALKTTFLQTTPITKSDPRNDQYYNVNTVRGLNYQPNSPIVHPYHRITAIAPLAVALPDSFRWNIPQDIRNQISQHNVDVLDILFTPQEEIRQADDSLKAAYWMFPNRPDLDKIKGAPPEYQKTILLGLFDSDHPIDKQVVTGQLKSFGVSLHEEADIRLRPNGRISPDTGHINTAAAPTGSFSFYSLAIFKEQRRAAVTLHWMLTKNDKNRLVALLEATQKNGAINHLEALIQAMNDPTSPFHGTSMMEKLMDLTKP